MTIKEIKQIIDSISYKPGYKFDAHIHSHMDVIEVRLIGKPECAYKRNGETLPIISTNHICLNDNLKEKDILYLLRSMVINYEIHEAEEWFLYGKNRVFDPHKKET